MRFPNEICFFFNFYSHFPNHHAKFSSQTYPDGKMIRWTPGLGVRQPDGVFISPPFRICETVSHKLGS
jgi:hypothetical protein